MNSSCKPDRTLERLLFAALVVLSSSVGASAQARAADPVEVRTETGPVVGAVRDGVRTFRGMPFAAPPVGSLRWRPPAPAAAWTAPRDARAFGPECIQPGADRGRSPERASEDCLTLNVWAPATGAAELRPVMVWIYGGGWVSGSGAKPYYDGAAFARRGVVLVTFNYRLGALGYFAHPALTAEAGPRDPLGNYGQMDQIAALRWVQHNIAAFGGDPARVSVFGESAGGGSILSLLATPSAKGLFSRAIVESGPAWTPPQTLATQAAKGVRLATRAGLGANATAAQLRALPARALLEFGSGGDVGPFPDGRLVPADYSRALAAGHTLSVPLVIGTNADEGSLVADYGEAAHQAIAALPPADLAAARKVYGAEAPDDAALERLMFADGVFGAPARWIAAHQRAPVWLYRFSYVSAPLRGRVIGARHGWEVPYVFDTLAAAPLSPTAQDQGQARLMNGCWADFAITGRPCSSQSPPASAWPAYDARTDALMAFDDAGPQVKTRFRRGVFDLHQGMAARRLQREARGVAP